MPPTILYPRICIDKTSSEGEYNYIKSVARTYNLYGFSSRAAAEAALLVDPSCPANDFDYPTLTRNPFNVEESDAVGYYTADVEWDGTSQLGVVPPVTGANSQFTGGVSIRTANIKSPISHVGDYAPTLVTPIPGAGVIGRNEDGSVDGADTTYPAMQFTESREFPKGTFNLAWLAWANQFVGQPNNAPWRGFGVWEAMILGIDGNSDTESEFDTISFTFEARPTFTDLVIETYDPARPITIPFVRGFEQYWCDYVPREKNGTPVMSAHTAHVERLHHGVDLNGILP